MVFPQCVLAAFNQRCTTVKAVNQKTGIGQGDHLSARTSGGHENPATGRETTANGLALPEKEAGVQVGLIRVGSGLRQIPSLCKPLQVLVA